MSIRKKLMVDLLTGIEGDEISVVIEDMAVASSNDDYSLTVEERLAIIKQLDDGSLSDNCIRLLQCSIEASDDGGNNLSCTSDEMLLNIMGILSYEDKIKLKNDILNIISETIDEFIK